MYVSMLALIAHAATETHDAAASSGLASIGLDVRALIFQLLNFAILLFLLKKFAYRPILNVLKARRTRIEESLRTAQEIEKRSLELAQEKQRILGAARTQAQTIVAQGKGQAQTLIRTAEETAKTKGEQVVKTAKAQVAQEVQEARHALKREVTGLVSAATEAIIDVKLDPAKDAELINNAIKQAAKQ